MTSIQEKLAQMSNAVLLEMYTGIRLEFGRRGVVLEEVARTQLSYKETYMFQTAKTGTVYCRIKKINKTRVEVVQVNEHNFELDTNKGYTLNPGMLSLVDTSKLKIEEPELPDISGDAAPVSTTEESW